MKKTKKPRRVQRSLDSSVLRHMADGTTERRTRELFECFGNIWGYTPDTLILALFSAIGEDYYNPQNASGQPRLARKET